MGSVVVVVSHRCDWLRVLAVATAFQGDAERYTDAKGPFIRGVVASASRGAIRKG
jgi:hypothetical protein